MNVRDWFLVVGLPGHGARSVRASSRSPAEVWRLADLAARVRASGRDAFVSIPLAHVADAAERVAEAEDLRAALDALVDAPPSAQRWWMRNARGADPRDARDRIAMVRWALRRQGGERMQRYPYGPGDLP